MKLSARTSTETQETETRETEVREDSENNTGMKCTMTQSGSKLDRTGKKTHEKKAKEARQQWGTPSQGAAARCKK